MANRPVARRISRSSRTSMVTEALCGSAPIITPPMPALLASSRLARAGNATSSRADPSSATPHRGVRQDRIPWKSHAHRGGQPQDERPAGHLDPSLARPEPWHQPTRSRVQRLTYAVRMQVLVIDGANVVGSRPDGWWRDRAGAAGQLQERLSTAALPHDEVVLVLEGDARRGNPAGQDGRLRTVH